MDSILGYGFANTALLEEALTTPAYRMDVPDARDNQRLEFLGDSVLGFLTAETLYAAHPDEPEGPLTVRRTHMVSAAALCAAAARLGIVPRLKRNRAAIPLDANAKTIADAVEAIIGAAYLDGGLDAARQVVSALELDRVSSETAANPKGDLQIRAQAMKPPRHPAYELISTTGKAHDPLFTVRVSVDGIGEATATAHNRKEAEARAAQQLLEVLKVKLKEGV